MLVGSRVHSWQEPHIDDTRFSRFKEACKQFLNLVQNLTDHGLIDSLTLGMAKTHWDFDFARSIHRIFTR